MRVCLNVAPFEVTSAQVQAIRTAAGGADVDIVPADALDEVDGYDVDVLVTSQVPEPLDRWPRLRLVQLASAGYDHLQRHAIWRRPIAVTTAAGIHAVAMAEYATCALLMLTHGMLHTLTFKQHRRWDERMSWYFQPQLLRGQTAGILGYGAVGRECARQLAALGMRIVCVNRSPRGPQRDRFSPWQGTGDPSGELPRQWFSSGQLHEMLPLCDALVVTLPHTPATKHLIGPGELAMLKPGVRLIIISRGRIVDEQALAMALQEGKVAGAAVDTFAEEPLAEASPLFEAPNTILTPHISGGFKDYWPVLCQLACENIRRLVRGEPLLNRVQP